MGGRAGWRGQRQAVRREDEGGGACIQAGRSIHQDQGSGTAEKWKKRLSCSCLETVRRVARSRERHDSREPEPPRARAREQEHGRQQAGDIHPTDGHHQMH